MAGAFAGGARVGIDSAGAARIAGADEGSVVDMGRVMRIAVAPESASDPELSQYLDAVLMRASAAIRKTPEVPTWSPAFSPASTSYMPFDAAPTETSWGRKRP